MVDYAAGKEIESHQLAFAAEKKQLWFAGSAEIALHRQGRGDRSDRGDEIPLQGFEIAVCCIEAEGECGKEEDFQDQTLLLHDIPLILPEPSDPGAGISGLFQIVVPDPEDRHGLDEQDSSLQGIGCRQIFCLFPLQGRGEGPHRLLIEDQVALAVEFCL
ncbi:MAG: hypothetical protein ACD_75C00935G0002 [uncultured bacterium]|nr:MAG: hypothetical protein ACD_75C00935G0002 [uncultured bacterium]